MKKLDQLIISSLFVAGLAPLLGDDGSSMMEMPTNRHAVAFPYNPDQGWYTQETLLIWKPYLEDADFGNTSRIDLSGQPSVDVNMKKPNFDWNAGVRVGVGRYLPHDLWDFSVWMTYYYGTASHESSPNLVDNKILTSAWHPSPNATFFQEGEGMWRLNFFNWDVNFGREYKMLRTLTAHPFFGVRVAAIYQDYKARYLLSNFSDAVAEQTVDLTEQFKAKNQFIGGGPRIGTDFAFQFQNNWALTGSFAGAFLAGGYSMSERINSSVAYTLFETSTDKRNYKIRDNNYDIRAQIEGSFGIGYEAWVKNHTVRIAPSIVFEASTWFAMNDYLRLSHRVPSPQSSNPLYLTHSDRLNGDLSFLGVNINLHIDF